MFARYGMRNLTTDDQPNIPLPSGGAGNGHIYARNRQFVLGSTWTPTASRCSKCDSATRGRRRARIRRRSAAAARRISSGSRAASRPRIAGGLPTQLITGYSDLGRQATNPQWQYPTVYNPKINYTWTAGAHSLRAATSSHIDTEVQDVNPLYGRDTYNGSSAGRPGRGEQPL